MDSAFKPGENPTEPGQRYGFVFLVFFLVIIGNYLLMNLLVCGVVVVYDKLKVRLITTSRHHQHTCHQHTSSSTTKLR
jgi:hypothetical protein